MDTKLHIIGQLRRLQSVMQRVSFNSVHTHSPYRGQGLVLSILKDHVEISRKDLGERVDISRQALTELLQKMEKNGLIVRKPGVKDRRVIMIRLTKEGRKAAMESDLSNTELPHLLDCLDEERLAVFSECLEDILLHHRKLYPSANAICAGPENCTHCYLKFGHTRPNPKFCKYAHLFPPETAETPENAVPSLQVDHPEGEETT